MAEGRSHFSNILFQLALLLWNQLELFDFTDMCDTLILNPACMMSVYFSITRLSPVSYCIFIT